MIIIYIVIWHLKSIYVWIVYKYIIIVFHYYDYVLLSEI